MTWREYYEGNYGSIDEAIEGLQLDDEELVNLDDEADPEIIFDHWSRTESPNAKAYYLLDSLDIGHLTAKSDSPGELIFYDGPFPGSEPGSSCSRLRHTQLAAA